MAVLGVIPVSVLSGHSWRCSGGGGPYGIKLGSAMCKAKALPAVLLLQPHLYIFGGRDTPVVLRVHSVFRAWGSSQGCCMQEVPYLTAPHPFLSLLGDQKSWM